MSSIDWTAALDCLERASRVLITCHIRPDGDALGSAAGLARIVQSKGKSAQIILPSELSDTYKFLFEDLAVRVMEQDWTSTAVGRFDAVVILDTSVEQRLKPQIGFLKTCGIPILVIDHHLVHGQVGTLNIIDPTASSTGLLIAELARAWSVNLSSAVAVALFVAVATDSGWFRYAGVNGRTFRQAAELVRAGAKPNEIHQALYMQVPAGKMRLLGRVLSSLELLCGGRLACMSIVQDDMSWAGADPTDTEDLINEGMRIGSVETALMLIEDGPGEIRMSFRSKGALDVAEIAGQFGGGGHKLAAGGRFAGTVAQAKQKAVAAIEQGLASSD